MEGNSDTSAEPVDVASTGAGAADDTCLGTGAGTGAGAADDTGVGTGPSAGNTLQESLLAPPVEAVDCCRICHDTVARVLELLEHERSASADREKRLTTRLNQLSSMVQELLNSKESHQASGTLQLSASDGPGSSAYVTTRKRRKVRGERPEKAGLVGSDPPNTTPPSAGIQSVPLELSVLPNEEDGAHVPPNYNPNGVPHANNSPAHDDTSACLAQSWTDAPSQWSRDQPGLPRQTDWDGESPNYANAAARPDTPSGRGRTQ